MNISLFGATGFIGSNFREYSINQVESVDRSFPSPSYPDVLYLIGTTDNYNVLSNPTIDIEVNLLLLIQRLQQLREKFGTFTFNYVSSWFVYGEAQKPPFLEDGPCDPKGFYSISKLAAEKYVESYCQTFGITFRIIRLANVFGQNDGGISEKKNALQYLISKVKNNEQVELYEDGKFYRDYIDVRDVVSAIDLIITSDVVNEIINVGTGVPTQFRELILEAKLAFNSNSEIRSVPTPTFHKQVQVKDAWLDTTKLDSLGFKIQHPIMAGIQNL
jgi:nucleoside-diphosphate-sugar epimerase